MIKACQAAANATYGYLWIDTCCIDKANIVELSEAINSMFQWYCQAGICLAYLGDVQSMSDYLENSSAF